MCIRDRRSCAPVRLDERDAELYYEGFSNSALWPLFHGFPQHARFDEEAWDCLLYTSRCV